MYAGLFAAFVLLFQRKQVLGSLTALVVAVVVTTVAISVLWKFGWSPAFLKNRAELQAIRAERIAQRQASRAAKAGKPLPSTTPDRSRPAPTKRTSTGATNRPRRTRDNRKR
jgi:type II secretory pathway pseudopilin PulG